MLKFWSVLLLFAPMALWGAEVQVVGVNYRDYRDYRTLFFEPELIRANPGDRISFVVDRFDHQPQSIFLPDGATPWKSEDGASVTVSLSAEGLYLFDCSYHNVMGMVGAVLVGEPDNMQAAKEFYQNYAETTLAINKDRLDYLWEPGFLSQP